MVKGCLNVKRKSKPTTLSQDGSLLSLHKTLVKMKHTSKKESLTVLLLAN